MRVWLNPPRMALLGNYADRHRQRIGRPKLSIASGQDRRRAGAAGASDRLYRHARGRLEEATDFGNIVLRSNGPNGTLRIRDVARVELGAVSYDAFTNLDGKPALGIAVYLLGRNALKVADRCGPVSRSWKRTSRRASRKSFHSIPTRFVDSSIHEVIITLMKPACWFCWSCSCSCKNWTRYADPDHRGTRSLIARFGGCCCSFHIIR